MGYMEFPDQLERTDMLALGNLLHEHSTLHTLELSSFSSTVLRVVFLIVFRMDGFHLFCY